MAKRRKKRAKRRSKYFLVLLLGGILSVAIYFFFEYKRNYTTPNELELPTIPQGYNSYGIDISHYQGEIDWDMYREISDSLISFVYCKATEGVDHVDRNWNSHKASLREAKILHGCYHFFRPNSDAIAQAEHFLKHYSVTDQELPPVLDSEIEGPTEQMVLNMKKWLEHVEDKTGRRPLIYTSNYMYNTKFKEKFPGYKFWIANYNPGGPDVNDENIVMWQYTDKGSVPGIYGPVDMNYSKINYRD